jgi:glycosyltransferase involved in cell wall biosynthesis
VLKVAAYTGGIRVPSARFRVRQYIEPLRALGVDLREHHAAFGAYPPRRKAFRPFWAAAALGDRLLAAARSYAADLTLLQREMISTLLTGEPLTRQPRVLDVDDAIFLRRGGACARRLARLSDLVICGNAYLAEHFSAWNRDVRILPTAVDTDRFRPGPPLGGERPSIGWSGTSSGFPYLEAAAPAVLAALNAHPGSVFRVVADRRPPLPGFPPEKLDFIPWSPETEVAEIQKMTVGIMPLEDSAWARGKCSFKLLTYMSCGVPVVASPVGMNAEVLAAGGGIGPRRWEDWSDALSGLLGSEDCRRRLGQRGRQAVLERYSLRAIAPRLAGILKSFGGGK